jgi:hypothetical protein
MKLRSLSDVQELGRGAMKMAFERELAIALKDCEMRPALGSKRTITLTLEFIPIVGHDGDLDEIAVVSKINGKQPESSLAPIMMTPDGRDGLDYSEFSPRDPKQKSLIDEEDAETRQEDKA